jgi:hypothetical protein
MVIPPIPRSQTMTETKRERPDWAAYERAKQQWVWQHPEATHEEYEAAMLEIARRLGV